MILCSCNVLTKKRILAAAEELVAANPGRPVTPARIFKMLGGRPQCGTCFSLVRQATAEAGIAITCPEPLASVADDGDTVTITTTRVDVTILIP
jgi:bacterioferritin-associated ferredoxin